MADTGARLSSMAKHCFQITTSPEFATRFYTGLVFTQGTPARHTLYVWPSFPLLIRDRDHSTEDVDDFVAVLKCSDRVVKVDHYIGNDSDLETVSGAMQVPFPELTDLQLHLIDGMESVLSDSFLGASVKLRSA